MRVRSFFVFTAAWLVVAACDSSDAAPPASSTDAGASADAANGSDAGAPIDGGAQRDDAGGDAGPGDAGPDGAIADAGPITVTSTAFVEGGTIPVVHSVCDGDNASIPLAWTGAPPGTMSFAVVMRDLTLGGSANYHWVLYDVPSSVTSLAQDLPKDLAPNPPGGGAKQTRWSFGSDTGFQGMCPIAGPSTHVYELAVYAVDVATLPAAADPADPAQVDANIQAHQIAVGRLRGSYTKQ